jgi:hypothetical protein
MKPLTLLFAALTCAVSIHAQTPETPLPEAAPNKLPTLVVDSTMTKLGKSMPMVSRESPVAVAGKSSGFRPLGPALAGENIPNDWAMNLLLNRLLANRGFIPAKGATKPEQFITLSWGTFRQTETDGDGRHKGMVMFMGGEKLNIMNDVSQLNVMSSGGAYTRNLRGATANYVLNLSSGDLYYISIKAFKMADEGVLEANELWQTNIACPTAGIPAYQTIPLMAVAAIPHLGTDLDKPLLVEITPTDWEQTQKRMTQIQKIVDDLLAKQKAAENAAAENQP